MSPPLPPALLPPPPVAPPLSPEVEEPPLELAPDPELDSAPAPLVDGVFSEPPSTLVVHALPKLDTSTSETAESAQR